VEVRLLVPGWQCAALERAARGQGLTIGQLLRHLIGGHLFDEHARCTSSPNPYPRDERYAASAEEREESQG
jgi:hypothetical protein